MVGYSKEVLFNYRHQYWLWTPILGPICGGLVGTWLYDSFVFTGHESIVNKPNAVARSHWARAGHVEIGVVRKSGTEEVREAKEGLHGRHSVHDVV